MSEAGAERGVGVVERALAGEGPLTRDELRERLDAAGVPTAGQALVHVLMLASLRGLVVRGPMKGATQAFVLVRDWLGAPRRSTADAALAELARRHLAGHGPASDRDLAAWAGITLRDARTGLAAIAGELVARGDGLGRPRRPRARRGAPPAAPARPVRPRAARLEVARRGSSATTRGRDVERHLPADRARGRARGRDVGPGRREVRIEPFERLTRRDAAALDADADDVVRYLALVTRAAQPRTAISPVSANGGTRSIRSPLQKRPGSYQLAGRRSGSRPMCWYVVATSSAQ